MSLLLLLGLTALLLLITCSNLATFLTAGRTNEIGIRLSLGSTRSQIVGLAVRDSVWMIAIGGAAGVPLGLGAMDAAKALLFGLSPTDLPTVVAALAGLAAAAALAGCHSRVARLASRPEGRPQSGVRSRTAEGR